jgi:hypothetical protein
VQQDAEIQYYKQNQPSSVMKRDLNGGKGSAYLVGHPLFIKPNMKMIRLQMQ